MTFGVIGWGFLVVGGLGYAIRVIHIPFNEILVTPRSMVSNRRSDMESDMKKEWRDRASRLKGI